MAAPVAPQQQASAAVPAAAAAAATHATPAAAPGPGSPPRFALALDERGLRLLRDSYRRVEEALQDAYETIDEHQQKAHCQLDLDRVSRYELDYLRKVILAERLGAPVVTPAH